MKTLEILHSKYPNKIVLSKSEVCEVIGYYESTVDKLLPKGETILSSIFYKAGKAWVCDVNDLAEFIDAGHHKHIGDTALNTSGKVRSRTIAKTYKNNYTQ